MASQLLIAAISATAARIRCRLRVRVAPRTLPSFQAGVVPAREGVVCHKFQPAAVRNSLALQIALATGEFRARPLCALRRNGLHLPLEMRRSLIRQVRPLTPPHESSRKQSRAHAKALS